MMECPFLTLRENNGVIPRGCAQKATHTTQTWWYSWEHYVLSLPALTNGMLSSSVPLNIFN